MHQHSTDQIMPQRQKFERGPAPERASTTSTRGMKGMLESEICRAPWLCQSAPGIANRTGPVNLNMANVVEGTHLNHLQQTTLSDSVSPGNSELILQGWELRTCSGSIGW